MVLEYCITKCLDVLDIVFLDINNCQFTFLIKLFKARKWYISTQFEIPCYILWSRQCHIKGVIWGNQFFFFRHLEIRNVGIPRKSRVPKYYDYYNMYCKDDNIMRCSRYNFWYLFILFNHNCFCLSIQNKHKYIINTEFL